LSYNLKKNTFTSSVPMFINRSQSYKRNLDFNEPKVVLKIIESALPQFRFNYHIATIKIELTHHQEVQD